MNNTEMCSKPNVLLITVDHWPGNLLGCEGHEEVKTPTLDALARCGVRFSRAYSPTPVCIPARRELMTGLSARTHGDRSFQEQLEMPLVTSMPQAFRDQGYQAFAAGKLHVYPQRSRIGFDDVILNEEGRKVNFPYEMREDDYTRFINRAGHAGMDYAHGMSNNNYLVRPWHLPEELHPTFWTVAQTCEQILRLDPGRPAFWYCGFSAPHPPLVPPQVFLDMYRDAEPELPAIGEWARQFEDLPYALKYYSSLYDLRTDKSIRDALRGFYASCTQIDHAIRLIIGTLREEKLLDNTIIAFVSDHGDMLGRHGLWAKNVFYEPSCRVPLLIVPTLEDTTFGFNATDDRLVELRDIMPTLLEMCGLDIPDSVEGFSLANRQNRRDEVYGELWEDNRATRMIRTERYKLVYYALGNRIQLFDLQEDPLELNDLANDSSYKEVIRDLTDRLMSRLYGHDLQWVVEGALTGQPDQPFDLLPVHPNCGVLKNRDLLIQRGLR
ncbi:sulfatase-like hydrolase/transferase [Paenibacillus koleovorans]|uniref:sulfatase-like hydrolase/transferase n=1 Tax=Paenibacillus koleovorans TaxID=121608 RepID=UPI000FDB2A1A|nr:sulfatase-like hydrolase/transferase [Paenibacillus koleovorans]